MPVFEMTGLEVISRTIGTAISIDKQVANILNSVCIRRSKIAVVTLKK